jgi:predicted DNA-binding protein (MmcQ/YjbR family)
MADLDPLELRSHRTQVRFRLAHVRPSGKRGWGTGGTLDPEGMLAYCGSRPGAVEDYPFGDDVAVFKVGGRVFALCSLTGRPGSVRLKCDPTLAEALRERNRSVRPGYHLNKRLWNTIELDGSVPDDELTELVDHSWELVVDRLPRRDRESLRPRRDAGSR